MSQGLAKPESSIQLALQLDDSTAGTLYVGKALPGTATSTAAWRIKRLVETAGALVITWADGNANFDNIWDDRTGLSYS